MKHRVLILDDDEPMRVLLRAWLAGSATCWDAGDAAEALQILLREVPDVALVDVVLPGAGGRRFVEDVQRYLPGCALIGISGQASPSEFVELLRLGMADFLPKPFTKEAVLRAIPRALRVRALRDEVARLSPEIGFDRVADPFDAMLGESPAWGAALTSMRATARLDGGILIEGATGSGKDLAARCIHEASARAGHPFVIVPCGALAASLVQLELFGHAAGAFTGAMDARLGAFEAARSGSIVLSEIGALPHAVQGSLLRVLDAGAVQRVGESAERLVDVRVIATTSVPVAELVASGRLRDDLRQRVDRLRVELPPLTERADDVLLLAAHFLRVIAAAAQRRPPALSAGAAAVLRAHDWPGNVRELRNVLQQACIAADWQDQVDERHFSLGRSRRAAARLDPSDWPMPEAGVDLPKLMADVERDLVSRAMTRAAGNHERASALLRIARSSLERKLTRTPPRPS